MKNETVGVRFSVKQLEELEKLKSMLSDDTGVPTSGWSGISRTALIKYALWKTYGVFRDAEVNQVLIRYFKD